MSTSELTEDIPADTGEILRRMASLTGAQQQLLGRIANRAEPVTVTELAEEAGLHVSSVRETLDALYGQGLVLRRSLPAQGRGRPALGYVTYVPVDPGFPAQLLNQLVNSVLTWLRECEIDSVVAAREIGAHWAHAALRAMHVPDHSAHKVAGPDFSLEAHMGKIRMFLTTMGFAARPCEDGETSFLVTALPFGDSTNPEPLALELRRGLIVEVLKLTSAGTADIEYVPDESNPLWARINLIPRPAGAGSDGVVVHFYGGSAEAAGGERMVLPAQAVPATLGALLDQLCERRPELAGVLEVCSFLVGGRTADRDSRLGCGDRVDVLPPFAGG
ncbi:MoaD/ThiS family protein [Buchananella felis]|uniref:MoaD/ThiS family protein n=1 Tax=Buchananella felis TaxID=3231492 RepID=UPI0035272D0D